MKTLLYTLSFVLVSTLGVAQITTGYFGGSATLDNVAQPNNGQTTNKWIRIAEFTLNGNWSPAGITVDFFPRNSNHGDSRQQLNVQFRNNHGTAIESTHDISLVTFYGAQKTIKDVKVVHTSGTGVTNNKLSVWVQIGASWLGSIPIEVRTYGNVTFKTTNQPYYTSITDTGTVYDLKSSYSMVKSNNTSALTIKDNGNVGIGTTNPLEKLHVNGGAIIRKSSFSRTQGSHENGWIRDDWLTGNRGAPVWNQENERWVRPLGTYNDFGGIIWQDEGVYFIKQDRGSKTEFTNDEMLNTAFLFANTFSKNIGIGTTIPEHKLDVFGSARFGVNKGLILYDDPANSVLRSINNHFHLITNRDQDDIYFRTGNSADFRMTIKGNGNVGIGTTNPAEKLSVNGNIRAKEIKIEIENWPDYVFKNDYKLLSLADVKKHIATKGHLPNMPSATVVKEQGAALGALNVKLLEKIEELTLYTLEQEAQLQQQQHINKTLMERLSQIESQLNQHEKPTP